MQVNKRRSSVEEHHKLKRKKHHKKTAESIEEAALGYDKHGNIDSELISQQAQSLEDETAQYTNPQSDNEHNDADTVAAAAAVTAVAEAHESAEREQEPEHQQQREQEQQQRPSQQILHQHGDKPLAGSEAWHRIRKDNHKEVERRRRENISAGIKELSSLLPSPETNKSQILQRAIEHIKRLKENESNNIEKWTLEKLLNDQQVTELSASNDKLKAELERAYREVEHWKKIAAGRVDPKSD